MGRLIFIGVFSLLVIGLALPVLAEEKIPDQAGVGFDLEGYFRVRYDNLFQTGWRFNEDYRDGTYNEDSDWWSYFDQRGLFLPTMHVGDKIVLKAQVDVLRNVLFGTNAEATLPLVDVERNPSDTQQIETIQFDAQKFDKGNVFSQVPSDNQSYYSYESNPRDSINSLVVSRLWAEVMLPVGFLRFGRMPSQFGMGIFSNDGLAKKTEFGWEGLDKNYGDTYDRLMFGTKIGSHYVPVLVYDRVMEGDFKSGNKDVQEFILVQYVRDIKVGDNGMFNGGLYVMHRRQQSTSARIFLYDLWLKLQLGGFTLENEAIALQGALTMLDHDTVRELEDKGLPTGQGGGKIEVNAYLEAFRGTYNTRSWGAGGEFGFSSPADPNPEKEFDPAAATQIAIAAAKKDADPDSSKNSIDFINAVAENQAAFGRRVFTFPFDKDYNVDMIIWKTLMGGAVKNGIYAKAGGYIHPVDEFKIRADLIKSWINEPHQGKNGREASHDLGWEIDLDFSGDIYDHFFTGIQFGYAFVGPYFKNVYDDASNIFEMKMRAGITF